MRDIKFRGKRLDTGEWIYGALVKEYDGWSICDWSKPDYGRYDVDPETVGQYTGDNDKNGQEIYEDDYVARQLYARTNRGPKPNGQSRYLVKWTQSIHVVGFNVTRPEGLEVIGDRHDDPGLLE